MYEFIKRDYPNALAICPKRSPGYDGWDLALRIRGLRMKTLLFR